MLRKFQDDKEIKRILLEDILGLKKELIRDNFCEINLFSQMPPRDMISVFFQIEKVFDIKFSEENILKNEFETINSISNLIINKLSS